MWNIMATDTLASENKEEKPNLNEKALFFWFYVSFFSTGISWKFINTDTNRHSRVFPGLAYVA